MQCTRCQGGFIALLYDELKCLNCGHRPKPLRPHEIKELRGVEVINVRAPAPKPITCMRCKEPPLPGRKMCHRHLELFRLLMRSRRHRPVNTSVLTASVFHVTQTIQGV